MNGRKTPRLCFSVRHSDFRIPRIHGGPALATASWSHPTRNEGPMSQSIARRAFLQSTAAAIVAAGGCDTPRRATRRPGCKSTRSRAAGARGGTGRPGRVRAGPAGIAAAIAAARLGASTRLIESNGCLGGVWTARLLSWILDASNKTGLMQEILRRLTTARHWPDMAARWGTIANK